MGAGRAGWYSYDQVDNGGHSSAEEILPQFQQVEAGDIFPWLPGATDGFVLLSLDPGRHLVLSALDPKRSPIVTWTFVLEPGPDALFARRAEHSVRGRLPQLSTTLL
jgi:hypothetical protein